MANKLYEETAVADIAVAIRQAHGGTDKYTVAQMGDAIRANRRVYEGELTETIVGLTAYLVLAKEDVLAEHRSDDTLFVRVAFDVEAEAYTVIRAWAANVVGYMAVDGGTGDALQFRNRYNDNTVNSFAYGYKRMDSEVVDGVGSILITADGELRIYSGSVFNYTLRPSKWKVIVEWGSIT